MRRGHGQYGHRDLTVLSAWLNRPYLILKCVLILKDIQRFLRAKRKKTKLSWPISAAAEASSGITHYTTVHLSSGLLYPLSPELISQYPFYPVAHTFICVHSQTRHTHTLNKPADSNRKLISTESNNGKSNICWYNQCVCMGVCCVCVPAAFLLNACLGALYANHVSHIQWNNSAVHSRIMSVLPIFKSVGSFCLFQWRQADSIRHLGKVTLAQEQDYTGLIVGCVCVSLLLLLLGTLLMWKRNKHIDGKGRAKKQLHACHTGQEPHLILNIFLIIGSIWLSKTCRWQREAKHKHISEMFIMLCIVNNKCCMPVCWVCDFCWVLHKIHKILGVHRWTALPFWVILIDRKSVV